jgi:hypothetical protein
METLMAKGFTLASGFLKVRSFGENWKSIKSQMAYISYLI